MEHGLLIFNAFLATLSMVSIAFVIAFILGLPIAVLLNVTRQGHLAPHPFFHKLLGAFVTLGRSVPFVILMIALIPLTRWLVGTSIGTAAATVPLAAAAVPFFARIAEGKLAEVSPGILEAGRAMGFSPAQIIFRILLPESFSGLIHSATILLVSLVEYSAMAGAVGGSGLGNTALQYGYYQFDNQILFEALAVLVFLVLVVQYTGDFITARCSHKKPLGG